MAVDVSRIRALCFDVDGTLSDTDDQFVLRICRWLQPVRFIFPGRDPRPLARKFVMASETPASILFGLPDRLGIDSQLARMSDFFYRLGLGKQSEPYLLVPSVGEMLRKLKPHFPMSIVSARGPRTISIFLKQFDLEGFFAHIVTATTCRHTKPYPDPVLWAAARMNVAPEACLMIGDTTVDIRAGKAAGAQTVGVLCGFGTEKELISAGADLILQQTSELLHILAI